jgi:DNA end-binding protein Ku
MRAIWNGVVSFGLVSVAVRLYAATFSHNIAFHQVHEADGGRIRYRRVCEVCGNEIDYVDIAKGYETEDGELVILDADDMASLPISTSREIEVIEFVPSEQVDPLLMDRSYYLEPDAKAVKPYALLRETLKTANQMAVVKVALRQRETLALLRVRDRAIVLQTMLWPDEVREPDFETLSTDVELRPQELQMASMLVSSMAADFDPFQFDDEYRKAVEELIEFKREHGDARPVPAAAETGDEPISDLLTALRRSVEEARAERGVPKPRTGRKTEDEPPDEGNPTRTRGRPKTSTPKTSDSDKNPTSSTRKSTAAEAGQSTTGTRKPTAGTGERKPASDTGTRKPAGSSGERKPEGSSGERKPAGSGVRKPAGGKGEQKPTTGTGEPPPGPASTNSKPAASARTQKAVSVATAKSSTGQVAPEQEPVKKAGSRRTKRGA